MKKYSKGLDLVLASLLHARRGNQSEAAKLLMEVANDEELMEEMDELEEINAELHKSGMDDSEDDSEIEVVDDAEMDEEVMEDDAEEDAEVMDDGYEGDDVEDEMVDSEDVDLEVEDDAGEEDEGYEEDAVSELAKALEIASNRRAAKRRSRIERASTEDVYKRRAARAARNLSRI